MRALTVQYPNFYYWQAIRYRVGIDDTCTVPWDDKYNACIMDRIADPGRRFAFPNVSHAGDWSSEVSPLSAFLKRITHD